uniref:Uncharacterized protein n=1 Tax=Sphingomonas sp. JE1 TaxID=1628059 RepID=A0A0D5A0F2_9SPHN|nr:hypothetical protein pJE1_236 [Sphingomonas sp. JE1]
MDRHLGARKSGDELGQLHGMPALILHLLATLVIIPQWWA